MLAYRINHRILHGLEKLYETKSRLRSLQTKVRSQNREGNALKLLYRITVICDANSNYIYYGESKWQLPQL